MKFNPYFYLTFRMKVADAHDMSLTDVHDGIITYLKNIDSPIIELIGEPTISPGEKGYLEVSQQVKLKIIPVLQSK